MNWLTNAWVDWYIPFEPHTNRFYKALASEAFVRAVWWEEKRRQRAVIRLPYKKGDAFGKKRTTRKREGRSDRAGMAPVR